MQCPKRITQCGSRFCDVVVVFTMQSTRISAPVDPETLVTTRKRHYSWEGDKSDGRAPWKGSGRHWSRPNIKLKHVTLAQTGRFTLSELCCQLLFSVGSLTYCRSTPRQASAARPVSSSFLGKPRVSASDLRNHRGIRRVRLRVQKVRLRQSFERNPARIRGSGLKRLQMLRQHPQAESIASRPKPCLSMLFECRGICPPGIVARYNCLSLIFLSYFSFIFCPKRCSKQKAAGQPTYPHRPLLCYR